MVTATGAVTGDRIEPVRLEAVSEATRTGNTNHEER